jgi:hypothetical protein
MSYFLDRARLRIRYAQRVEASRVSQRMKVVGVETFGAMLVILFLVGVAAAAQSGKSDAQTTRTGQVRLLLDQRAPTNENGWFVVPVGNVKIRVQSAVPLKLVQFYAIKVRAGEVPRRIRDDSDGKDGFAAEFRANEAGMWNLWADAYSTGTERFVSNTLRVITRTESAPEKPPQ